MAKALLVSIKHFMEDNSDGFGRKCSIEELKSLTEQDRKDFREMFTAIGVETP